MATRETTPAVVAVPSSIGIRGRFSCCSTLYCAPKTAPAPASTRTTMRPISHTASPWRAPSKRGIRPATYPPAGEAGNRATRTATALPSPTVSTWLTASSAVSTPRARPSARPAADSSAIRMTASPLADSQPKTAAPHLRPPKRTRWATTASRAVPRVADAPSVRSEPPPVRTGTVWSTCVWSWCVRSLPTIVGLLRAGFSAVVPPCSGRCACPAVTWLIGVRGPVARLADHSREVGAVTVLLVDVANVVGSRPDGWWRDRAGATGRLLDRLAGLPGATLAGPGGAPLPVGEGVAVVEGGAPGGAAPAGGRGGGARAGRSPAGVRVVRAPGSGDAALPASAAELVAAGPLLVVTADRGLRA